ncbi:MAG: M35 family metallopeptidase [Roseococcus sp.]|nr:M35 family metallopeptidase [Roseococcus sp.]
MTRFTDQQAVTVDGQNITVKTRPGLDLPAVAALPGLIQDAKAHLTRADLLLAAEDFTLDMLSFARRYFLTGKSGPDKKELRQMRYVVSATRAGLSGDMTLKIGENVGRGDKDVHGSVAVTEGTHGTKPYHTVGTELSTSRFNFGGPVNEVRGAMKLSNTTLIGPIGLVTLIHEATHKYAGTVDYCYFKNDGVQPDGTFTNRLKALANADSYAWFVVAIGKPEVWQTNSMFSAATKSFDNPLYIG